MTAMGRAIIAAALCTDTYGTDYLPCEEHDDAAGEILASLELAGYAVLPKTGDGAAVAAQSMGGSLPPAVSSSLTEDGAATPPAVPAEAPALTGGELAVESATGAANTAAALSSPTRPGPALIGGQPGPRRFVLYRHTDISHVSGVGVVAWGVEFPDGSVAIRWHGAHPSTVAWASVADAIAIHGHSGATEIQWLDEEADRG